MASYDDRYTEGHQDAANGKGRRFPPPSRRGYTLPRLGYEEGYTAGLALQGTEARRLSNATEPTWACADCGQPCYCSGWGPHVRCGVSEV